MKLPLRQLIDVKVKSHSARSAWIETLIVSTSPDGSTGRTPQGVRGLKHHGVRTTGKDRGSHSARSAWIETV